MVKNVDQFIDPAIEDPKLREIDWHVALYTFMGNWAKVLGAKWRRVSYIQKG